MTNSNLFTWSLALLILVLGCKPKTEKTREQEDISNPPTDRIETDSTNIIAEEHNSRDSLDWHGTYQGTLPCADCEGIKTSITLFESGAYTRTVMYLGKEDRGTTDNGNFSWNAIGSKISLPSEAGGDQMYLVGENALFHLDADGQPIKGTLAERYLLEKNASDEGLEDKKWVLMELMGQEFVQPEGTKQAYITFHSELARVIGSNGCNVFTTEYQLKSMNRVSMGHLASTLMACPGMETAATFNDILQKVDNYSLSEEGILSLNRARMAPLAKFKWEPEE